MACDSVLCNSGIAANDVLCEVINKLDELTALTLTQLTLANDAIADLKTAGLTEISGIGAIDYNVTTTGNTGVDMLYSAPSEQPTEPDYSALAPEDPEFPDAPVIGDLAPVDAAPDVPDAYSVPAALDGSGNVNALISESDFDDIYDRAADRLARVGVKAERDAVYRASAMGVGMVSAALTIGLASAEEETNQRISDAALEQSNQEAIWKREDTKTLHGLHLTNWPLKPQLELDSYSSEEGLEIEAYKAETGAQTRGYSDVINGLTGIYGSKVAWTTGYLGAESARFNARVDKLRADISSEAERRGWSELQLRDILEQADKATAYAIQKANIILEVNRQTGEAVAQLMVGVLQGLSSAADYSLSGSGSQRVNASV